MAEVTWRSSAKLALIWLLATRALFLAAAAVLQTLGRMRVNQGYEHLPGWLFGAYARFDYGHFLRIALGGYFQLDRGNIAYDEAFFPGYPYAARGLAWVLNGGSITAASVTMAMALITWAGVFAAGTILIHLARQGRLSGVDHRLVAAVFFLGPYGVFYMAPYAEGPFVACALGAWELARRRRWGEAALVATIATALRANGLFLLPMLAFMVLHRRWRRPKAYLELAWLVLPTLPVALYFGYLRSITGSWFTWFETQEHWGRTFTWPWECLRFSIELISAQPEFALQRFMEVAAVGLFIVVIVQLIRWRSWDLMIFTGLTLLSLTTSSYLQSVPRAMLSCFPVLVVLASWLTRAPAWLRWLGLTMVWLMLAKNVSTILMDQWTG